MKEIKDTCYKGTRILLGDHKRYLLNTCVDILTNSFYQEISMPIIQYTETFKGKVGKENNNLMFNLKDGAERDLCLAPEYTAIIQRLAKKEFKYDTNVKLFYIQECFRGEKPQAGRYRQFTQLGVEILHPSDDNLEKLIELAANHLIPLFTKEKIVINREVTRGLDYYKGGEGFEIECPALGAQRQICGGGEYEGGIGFAIGVDRILSLKT